MTSGKPARRVRLYGNLIYINSISNFIQTLFTRRSVTPWQNYVHVARVFLSPGGGEASNVLSLTLIYVCIFHRWFFFLAVSMHQLTHDICCYRNREYQGTPQLSSFTQSLLDDENNFGHPPSIPYRPLHTLGASEPRKLPHAHVIIDGMYCDFPKRLRRCWASQQKWIFFRPRCDWIWRHQCCTLGVIIVHCVNVRHAICGWVRMRRSLFSHLSRDTRSIR